MKDHQKDHLEDSVEYQELYAKGFNDGYLLQQHDPELANRLSQAIQSEQLYISALKAGRDQYLAEVKERLQEHSKSQPNHSQTQGKDRGMDIDR